MSEIYQLHKTKQEITTTVLTNIIKMITAREWIAEKDMDRYISDLTSQRSDNMIYTVSDLANGKTLHIKFIPQKIMGVSKASGIGEFLNSHKHDYKLIVAKATNMKVWRIITSEFHNSEIFAEEDLMINLLDYCLIPVHIKLTDEQKTEVFEEYFMQKKNFPRLMNSDPVSRYYKYQEGDIIKIIRPSETAGQTVIYRRVVIGDITA